MILLVPCCGQSERFRYPTAYGGVSAQKQFTIHPNGSPLPMVAASGIQTKGIRFYIYDYPELKKHPKVLMYNKRYDESFLMLYTRTSSQVETVYNTLQRYNILDEPVYIKDCDNYFETGTRVNSLAVIPVDISDPDLLEKSFVVLDGDLNILRCIEKPTKEQFSKVVSNGNNLYTIAGGYGIQAKDFIKNRGKAKFISEVVNNCIANGVKFDCHWANNYVDFGTIEKYQKYLKTL